MSEKTVLIIETGGKYQIQKNELTDFELIGILECIIFDLKSVNRQTAVKQQPEDPEEQKQSASEPPEKSKESNQTDLRTRIGNAVKAIKNLGGSVEVPNLTNLTDEEMQRELNELTDQYKRLKKSKA